MNAKNLPLKFAFLALIIAVCLYAMKYIEPKQGIDLRGGSSLIFEIKTPQVENEKLQEEITKVKAQLATASAADKPALQRQLDGLQKKYDENAKVSTGNIAEDMIGILKERVDPLGLYSLEWRPVGKDRIEVRMPAGQEESRQAKQAYTEVLKDIESHNIQRSQISRLEQSSPQERAKLLEQLAPQKDSQKRQLLEKLLSDYDQYVAAEASVTTLREQFNKLEAGAPATAPGTSQPAESPLSVSRAALAKAQNQAADLEVKCQIDRSQIEAANINVQELSNVLKGYVSKEEADALKKTKPVEGRRRAAAFKQGMETLKEKHEDRLKEIQAAEDAFRKWSDNRRRLDDPSDLVRLIQKSGVLTFRMAPVAPGRPGLAISQGEMQQYLDELKNEGPEAGQKRNEKYQWFPIRGERKSFESLIVADYNGKPCVLLSNEPDRVLLNPPGKTREWSLADARPGADQFNMPAVDFTFDDKGATKFARLTSTNIKNNMAILLDDEVYSAPTIQSTISDRGQITGSFTLQEVQDLVKTFKAGSLPAKLVQEPVSVSSFGSSLGEINKKLSIRAGIYALLAVGGFMLFYYLLAGAIADFALILNLILIVGAMCLLNAVFTMPGIAGLILTIGVAVDSNVLINERLREEQERGLPIRLAFKNAYDRAFSAIFDSHVTMLLTSVILGWVGTEEVRGFAITLGLGIVFNLFTAVFVTRWIVQAMLAGRLIRNHQYMLHVFRHVPHINWIGLRYYFWAFSLLTALLGIVALFSQGNKIWGIEFSAGTQATLVFKSDALLTDPKGGKLTQANDAVVKELFLDAARKLGDAKVLDKNGQPMDFTRLRDSSAVETVIDPDQVSKFMQKYDANGDSKITLDEWKKEGGNSKFFELLAQGSGELDKAKLEKNLPPAAFKIHTTETKLDLIRKAADEAFGSALANRVSLKFEVAKGVAHPLALQLGVDLSPTGMTEIKPGLKSKQLSEELRDFEGGVLIVIDKISPAITTGEMQQRIDDMRLQPDEKLASQATNPTKIVGLTPSGEQGYSSFAILARPSEGSLAGDREAWTKFATAETNLVATALTREEAMTATNFDAAIAGDTSKRAIFAVTLSWLLIIAYLWLRFGSISWGLAAVVCLIHDSIIVIGMVAVSGWLSTTDIGKALLIGPFKVDLAMIAAILTIIGYSVNDTIVIFDRIRENRGKLKTVSPQVINSSINQTLSRTLLTVFTVFLTVLIMYIWAGESIRGFNYALLVGVLCGSYSSIAVAAPILLGFKRMVGTRAAAAAAPEAPSTNGGPADR